MKSLIKTLVLAGVLSLWAGAAAVKANVELTCEQQKCQYNERLGKSQTRTFDLYCKNISKTEDYSIGCHPPSGVTCLPRDDTTYYDCTCTNWSPSKAKYVDIDILCPSQ